MTHPDPKPSILWDDCGAQEPGEAVDAMPDWDMTNQSAPDYPEDQRTVW